VRGAFGGERRKNQIGICDLHPVHRQTHRRLSSLDNPRAGIALNNLHLETDYGIIDVITSVLGVGDFARLKERAIKIPLCGRMILLISLEDLIVAKEAVGREKDLLAVKELRAIAAMRAKKNNQLPTKNFNVRPRAPTRRSISC